MVSRFADIEVDWQTMEMLRSGAPVPLKPKAFQLLEYLFKNRDRVVPKDELFEVIWQGRIVSDGALTTAVNELRRALRDKDKPSQIIRTFYGQGLRFVADLDAGLETTAKPDAASPKADEVSATKGSRPGLAEKITIGIAVLPFDNLSSDPEQERLGEVIAEDLVTALSRFKPHALVSRTSSFAASRQNLSVPDLAEQLGVEYVVEGSLRPIGNSVRITVQLIDASRDEHAWAGTFDWDPSGCPDEQTAATSNAAGQVTNQLIRYEAQVSKTVPFEELTALQCYFRGYAAFVSTKRGSRREPIELFERAIDLNSDFTFVRVVLAHALSIPRVISDENGLLSVDKDAKRRDLARAEEEALLAIETDPNSGPAWAALAKTYVSQGRPDQGIGAAQTGVEIAPNLPAAHLALAESYLANGQAEAALEPLEMYVRLGPSGVFYWIALSVKALALTALSRHEEAILCSRDAQARSASAILSFFGEISAHGHLGRPDEAARVIERVQRKHPGFCAGLLDDLFWISNQETRELIHEGLKLAGLSGTQN